MWTQDFKPHLVIPAAQAELTAHAAGRGAVIFTDAILEKTKPHGTNQRPQIYSSAESCMKKQCCKSKKGSSADCRPRQPCLRSTSGYVGVSLVPYMTIILLDVIIVHLL